MRIFVSIAFVACAFTLQAQNAKSKHSHVPVNSAVQVNSDVQSIDTLQLPVTPYADSLQVLLERYRQDETEASGTRSTRSVSPYYFPLFSQGTLYNAPLRQSFYLDWTSSEDEDQSSSLWSRDARLTTLHGVNEVLAQMYVMHPELFSQTQQQLMEKGALAADISAPIKSENKLAEQAKLADIEHDVVDNIAAITRRPNFWTLRGEASLKFTQSYFSDNWFQGGDNNYAAMAIVTLEANYDNKQKLQWENKLEAQLGFQTTKGDTVHSFRVTNNLLRFTSKVGYKAFKTWYYTTRFQANTQLYPNYKTNSKRVTTDFASPLYLSLSVGMDYKWNKKRFSGSLYIAPVEANARYVDRKKLRANYNDGPNQATKWTWGPNLVVNYNWRIIDNISWKVRLYAFTNYHYTNIEMENTFSFNINKYLDCTLFVYPKYLDDRKYGKAKDDPNGSYWMFKEWLSLGVRYTW